jgi:hypothetical protein
MSGSLVRCSSPQKTLATMPSFAICGWSLASDRKHIGGESKVYKWATGQEGVEISKKVGTSNKGKGLDAEPKYKTESI